MTFRSAGWLGLPSNRVVRRTLKGNGWWGNFSILICSTLGPLLVRKRQREGQPETDSQRGWLGLDMVPQQVRIYRNGLLTWCMRYVQKTELMISILLPVRPDKENSVSWVTSWATVTGWLLAPPQQLFGTRVLLEGCCSIAPAVQIAQLHVHIRSVKLKCGGFHYPQRGCKYQLLWDGVESAFKLDVRESHSASDDLFPIKINIF